MNLIEISIKWKQNFFGRIALHIFFWSFIFFWFWKDFTTISVPKSNADYFVILAEILNLVLSFYLLSFVLQKSFKTNISHFFVFLFLLFIANEYFVYFLFMNPFIHRFEHHYNIGILKMLLTAQKETLWWNMWTNRKIIYVTMAFHFFYLVVPFSIKTVYELYKYVEKNHKLEKEKIALELSFLKSQVNPHFLFNTLNNIYSMMVDTDEKAAATVLKLSDLMRYCLYESSHDKIALTREINFLDDYIDLERIRLSKRASINFEKIGNFNSLQIPPLILLTFIENAFKHGIHSTKEVASVNIKLVVRDENIIFEVVNTVPSKSIITDLNKVGGIGLINARKRLEHFYTDNYSLVIEKSETHYTVKLYIKLNHES